MISSAYDQLFLCCQARHLKRSERSAQGFVFPFNGGFMSKFDEAIVDCKAQLDSINVDCDDKLLSAVAKGLGPSLYNRDANLVAAADKKELENVKSRFISRKLGVEGADADAAIQHAIDTIGSDNRQKLRPVFYYLIVKHLNKESVYDK